MQGRSGDTGALVVRLLGSPSVHRGAIEVALPRSRKVRGLLAFLALHRQPISRRRLCDLLWDVPNDPRGELRWCLSKLRGILDDDKRRVVTADDLVALDLTGCSVDALEVEAALASDLNASSDDRLVEVSELFGGDLLENESFDGHPAFSGWLMAERRRYHSMRVALAEEYAARASSPAEHIPRLDAWLRLAPFELRPHQQLLAALVQARRVRDAEEHLARTIKLFEAEGIDWIPLRDAWRQTRETPPPAPSVEEIRIDVEAPRVLADRTPRRAAVAVMPFTAPPERARLADGLTEDIIMQLAKLRVLFVIARGSVFALAERGVSPQEAARLLGVDYVVSGSLRGSARTSVSVELVDVRDHHIVWTEQLDADDAFAVLHAITQKIVAGVAEGIELAESQRAILKPQTTLDAWEAYHRALWHMYKFTGTNNREAQELFRIALGLDPTFSRAHAGLSFTHFQNAFLDLTSDRDRQIALAFDAAAQSLAADDRDPAAHWAMGRALWLRGAGDDSLVELQRSIELSPNFALGHYTLGFVHAQSGDPQAAIAACNHSRELSPFDPLQFAMLASRALAHVRLGELDEAADWAVKATARPNAHAHIIAIAAICLTMAERKDDARRFIARIRERLPSYTVEHFLRAFRFEPDAERRIRLAARLVDFM
jgi:DNA-binding SARP family transcriptional activator/Flp pilus assembly protein TadD